jgi:hypothetical protein
VHQIHTNKPEISVAALDGLRGREVIEVFASKEVIAY